MQKLDVNEQMLWQKLWQIEEAKKKRDRCQDALEDCEKELRNLLSNIDVDELLTDQIPKVRAVGLYLKERIDKFEKSRTDDGERPSTLNQLRDAIMRECQLNLVDDFREALEDID